MNDTSSTMPPAHNTWPKTQITFPFKSTCIDASLNGTPDDSHTIFDSVVTQTSISLTSKACKASESPCFSVFMLCCSRGFNLMQCFHGNSDDHSNSSCTSCKSSCHDKIIKLIWLMLQVCRCQRPQNTKSF